MSENGTPRIQPRPLARMSSGVSHADEETRQGAHGAVRESRDEALAMCGRGREGVEERRHRAPSPRPVASSSRAIAAPPCGALLHAAQLVPLAQLVAAVARRSSARCAIESRFATASSFVMKMRWPAR
jgi:hypothetical protein